MISSFSYIFFLFVFLCVCVFLVCFFLLFFFRESAVISSRFCSASTVVCLYVEQTPSTRSVPTTPSVSIHPPVPVPSLCICQFIYLYAFSLFSLQRDTLEMVGEPVSGMARCPYDPRHANVALFAGTVSCNEESTASSGDQTQFTAPETETSAPLCLPLPMIYSQTSRCVSCLVLIFLTLCYRSICIFPLLLNLLLLLFSMHLSPQMEVSLPAP